MVETKPDDTRDWFETGRVRILGRLGRATTDIGEAVGDTYRLVHAQEPVWVLDMRLAAADTGSVDKFRVILRTKDGKFEIDGIWYPGWIEEINT